MFGPMFDWCFAAVLGVMSVMLLLGKGEFFLGTMNGNGKGVTKKKSEEERLKYSRAMGIFIGVLALDEVMAALFPNNQIVSIANIMIAVAALVVIGNYAMKHR